MERAEDRARQAAKAEHEANRHTATVMTDGTCNGVVVHQYLNYINGGSTVKALSEVAAAQARDIGGGNFSCLEHMLLTQATALQAMFVDLALRAKKQDRFDGI